MIDGEFMVDLVVDDEALNDDVGAQEDLNLCVVDDDQIPIGMMDFDGNTDGYPSNTYPSNTGNQRNVIEDELSGTNVDVYETPGGMRYWCPRVDDSIQIGLNYEFESIAAVDEAYKKYATAAGKQGFTAMKDTDSSEIGSGKRKYRHSSVKRAGCQAEMKIKIIKGTNRYFVSKFVERHNHPLLAINEMKMTSSQRKLQYTDFRKVFNASSASIGPSKFHRMETTTRGGYAYMDATTVDYKNERRDMGRFVGNKDAQMLVNLLAKRRSKVPDFFFEYYTVNKELQAIFWADEIARLNFKEFGDTISFDATYRMNEHEMVFIPFIAIDNHKKSVVVGSALVCKENDINFTWVLKAFVKAHGKQPKFVITGQCLAMKSAIPKVFTESKHKLCMWHIMKKLPNKIGKTLDEDRTFKRRFNKLVWNTHITPEVFEKEWRDIVEEYDLSGNDWLNDMYGIRESWIPAYYVEDPMSGLMKTTSRSESSHAFFRIFAHYCNDLVRFLHAFDFSIEKQRNEQRCLEYVTRNTLPRCVTPLLIERNASEIFSRTVFYEIQKEIRKAFYFCALEHIESVGGTKEYAVSHKNKKSMTKAVYKVIQDSYENSLTCECNFYIRHGIICRHMFKVLLNNGAESIPECLICRRWTRDLVPVEIQAARARYGEVDVEKERLINGVYNKVDLLISRIRNDKEKMKELNEILDKMKVDWAVDSFVHNRASRSLVFDDCTITTSTTDPELFPVSHI